MGVARGRLFQWSASRFAQQQARSAGSAVRRVSHPPRLPMPTRAEKATASTRWRVFLPVGLAATKKAKALSAVLAPCWCHVGVVLVPCVRRVGPMLAPCWCRVGAVVVPWWCRGGALVAPCWRRDGAVLAPWAPKSVWEAAAIFGGCGDLEIYRAECCKEGIVPMSKILNR